MRQTAVVMVLALAGAAGCASSRKHEMAVQDLKAQVGVLESRVSSIDERQQAIEQKALSQREDVAYLKGKTSASPTNVSVTTMAPGGSEPVMSAGRRSGKNRGVLYHQPKVSMSTRDIQRALKRAGYYTGHIDGAIGPRTKKAVRAFQKASGLKPDGIIGQQTWAKLQEYLPSSVGGRQVSSK